MSNHELGSPGNDPYTGVAHEPTDEVDDNPDDSDPPNSLLRDLVEWVGVLVAAVLLALFFKAVLFQAFWIPSESMEATLQEHDRVLVNKLSYHLHDVNRGDVIVFLRPDPEPDDEIKDLIKRVVAVGGETVEGRDGVITIDGQVLIEPYLQPGMASTDFDFGPIEVADGQVFVMGDNRTRSYDSRYFGTIDEDLIKGRAFVRFWPFDRLGGL